MGFSFSVTQEYLLGAAAMLFILLQQVPDWNSAQESSL